MPIYIDAAFAHGTMGSIASEMTATTKAHLDAALATLLTGANTSAMLAGISGNVIVTTFRDGISTPNSGAYLPFLVNMQTAWKTNLIAHFAAAGIPYDPDTDSIIFFSPREVAAYERPGGVALFDPDDAQTVLFPYERALFHELAHVASVGTTARFDDFVRNRTLFEPWEADSIAITAENIIYRADFSGAISAGHFRPGAPTFSGVALFDALSGAPTMTITDNSAVFREESGGAIVRKIIHERGLQSPGAYSQKLNHYIILEATEPGTTRVIDSTGALSNLVSIAIGSGAASHDLAQKTVAVDKVVDLIETANDVLNPLIPFPNRFAEALNDHATIEASTARFLSAETSSIRSGPSSNVANVVVGPTVAPTAAPTGLPGAAIYLPVAAEGSVDTLVVGAAGFSARNANFTGRLDDLMGGAGDDILIGGDGTGSAAPAYSNRPNLFTGGAGDDIIVTGTGDAAVNAGADNDLIIAGSGDTIVQAGGGYDIVTFLDRTTAVNLDLNARVDGFFVATQAGAELKFKQAEVFLGSDADDVIKGPSHGVLMLGGGGNDEIHMRRGDVAIGGAGTDRFYLSTQAEPEEGETAEHYLRTNRVFIADFDNLTDEIYINGVLFTGAQVTATLAPSTAPLDTSQRTVYSGTSSYGLSFLGIESALSGLPPSPGTLRYANLYAGAGAQEGQDRIVLGDLTYEQGGSPYELTSTINEGLIIDIPTFAVGGTMDFSLSGPGWAQLAQASALFASFANDYGNEIDRWVPGELYDEPFGGGPLRWVGDHTPLSSVSAVGTISGSGSAPGDFTNDYSYVAEQYVDLGDFDEVAIPVDLEVPPGGPILLVANGTPDLIRVPADGSPSASLNVFANDGLPSLTLTQLDSLEIAAGANLFTMWFGTVSANSDGTVSAQLDASVLPLVSTLLGGAVIDLLPYYGASSSDTVGSYIEVRLPATVFQGTAGDDNLVGTAGEDELYGLAGNDTIQGLASDDLLDGGTGTDAMSGGAGNDNYVVDDSGDSVSEAADEGNDTVVSSVSFTLGANLERLQLSGLGAIGGTGNSLANSLTGNAASNSLQGLGGDDVLDGSGGADTLAGGLGNDLYYVDQSGDVITESLGQGTDEVRSTAASYSLSANIERLIGLLGSGQTLTGNASANFLMGGAGADAFNGGLGTDTVAWLWSTSGLIADLQTGTTGGDAAGDSFVSIENLTGGAGADTLSGSSAANLLDGGAGADTLTGRGGSDVYLVDDEADMVVEAAGGGTDEVRTALASWLLPGNVENLRYTGTSDFLATGNDLNNMIWAAGGTDELDGGDGHDTLYAGAGDDYIFGGQGADFIDGGTGADYMEGGADSDAYIVDNEDDYVAENADEGVDTIYTALADYTLADQVENLNGQSGSGQHLAGNVLANVVIALGGNDELEGQDGDDLLRGAAGDDRLDGGEGADLIVGGSGADVLTGGAGADRFSYDSYESVPGGADRIEDFVSGEDIIDLSAIDAGFWTSGNQAFSFIGTDAFSAVAGELRYSFNGTDTVIRGDTDGDGGADLVILLAGEVTPLVSDFVL